MDNFYAVFWPCCFNQNVKNTHFKIRYLQLQKIESLCFQKDDMSCIKGTEAVAQRLPVKKFLEILQNPQEKTCATVSFFNKTSGLRPGILFKKRLWYRYFL